MQELCAQLAHISDECFRLVSLVSALTPPSIIKGWGVGGIFILFTLPLLQRLILTTCTRSVRLYFNLDVQHNTLVVLETMRAERGGGGGRGQEL